jgi:hypothetical protein
VSVTPATGTTGSANINELLWQQQAQAIYNAMVAQHDTALAADWLSFYPAYHAANPTLSAAQVEQAFLDLMLSGGLSAGLTQTGETLGQVPGAAAQGAENAVQSLTPISNPLDYLEDIGNLFDKLSDPKLWLRVGEFIAGGLLLYVGLKSALPGAAATTTRAAKKSAGIGSAVKKVTEKVTPTGRAAATVARHERRVKASQTREHARNIQAKRKAFPKKELYP